MKNKKFTQSRIASGANTMTASTYKFRAECAVDAQLVRSMVMPWLQSWKEHQCADFINGELHHLGGAEVTVTLFSGAPSYGELLWLIDTLHNCHVIGDTIAPAQRYTGERKMRDEFSTPATKPSAEFLQKANDAVQARHQVLELELERAKYIARQQGAIAEQGSTWQAPDKDGNSPGWLVCIEAVAAGVTAIRRVSAIDRDMSALICGHEQPVARQMTLAG
jgi:hypothetical protein